MPELIFLVFSDSTVQEQLQPLSPGKPPGIRVSAIGLQAMFRPMFMPCQYSFAITFGIRGIDFNKPHKVRIIFKDPNENVLIDSGEQPVQGVNVDPTLPIEEANLMLGAQFNNVPFMVEGIYRAEVLFDGELLGMQTIPVRKMQQ